MLESKRIASQFESKLATVSAFAAPAIATTPAGRLSAERLCAAFTGDLLARIGTPDGLSDLEEQEHANGFWPLPGHPLPGAKADRLRTEDTTTLGPTAELIDRAATGLGRPVEVTTSLAEGAFQALRSGDGER